MNENVEDMMSESTPPEPQRDQWASSLVALEREQLLSYVEWAEVKAPWWYWPVYGAALAAFVAAYTFGPVLGTLAAVAFAATMGGLLRTVTSRSGVSTPRFRAMPGRLRATFVPIAIVSLAAIAAVGGALLVAEDPPLVLLGLAIGTCAAIAGWGHTVWYRHEAHRLAGEHGLRP